MSKIEMEPGDYHVAVRRRDHSGAPWRWEISAAAQTKAVEQSKTHFATMSQAMREGKAALKALLKRKFPGAA